MRRRSRPSIAPRFPSTCWKASSSGTCAVPSPGRPPTGRASSRRPMRARSCSTRSAKPAASAGTGLSSASPSPDPSASPRATIAIHLAFVDVATGRLRSDPEIDAGLALHEPGPHLLRPVRAQPPDVGARQLHAARPAGRPVRRRPGRTSSIPMAATRSRWTPRSGSGPDSRERLGSTDGDGLARVHEPLHGERRLDADLPVEQRPVVLVGAERRCDVALGEVDPDDEPPARSRAAGR